jgi:hypothetical protein
MRIRNVVAPLLLAAASAVAITVAPLAEAARPGRPAPPRVQTRRCVRATAMRRSTPPHRR